MDPIEIPQKDNMPHHFQNLRATHLIVETQDDEVLFPEGWLQAKQVALLVNTHSTDQITVVLEKLIENTSLRSLYIHWTDTQFPATLTHMGQLQHLCIVNHALRAIPGNIDDLRHLRTLRLATTSLLGLPSSIAKLKKLKEFYLMVHQMEQLPKSFTKLTHLEYFGLLVKDLDIRKDWGKDYHFPAKWQPSTEEVIEQLSLFPNLKRFFWGHSTQYFSRHQSPNPLPENLMNLQALEELELETLSGIAHLNQLKQMPHIRKVWGNFYIGQDFLGWLQETFPDGKLVQTDPEFFYSDGYYEIREGHYH